MALSWIHRDIRMIYRLFVVLCLILFPSAYSREDDDASRPLVISLPMRVGVHPGGQMYDDSEEEVRGEQRVVERMYDPYSDTEYPQEDNERNNDNYQGPNFLSWNPNNRFMVLQISDFIGSRSADETREAETPESRQPMKSQKHPQPQATDSEEHEEMEDTIRERKKRRRPSSQQGTFDFEDFRRMPTEPRRNYGRTKKTKSSSSSSERKTRKRVEPPPPPEDEDEEEGEVYGTDPVVHYLKERRGKGRKRNFGFDDMKQEQEEDDFTMREWWNY